MYTQRLGERVLITTDIKPIEKQCQGINEEEAKQDWVGEIVSINDPDHLGKVGICCCPSKNIHYVYPHQIFTISDSEDFMHEEYISASDLDDYDVIDDDDNENKEKYNVNKHTNNNEKIIIDGMEVEVINDDEWVTDDDDDEWETDEDEEMIDDNNKLSEEIVDEEMNDDIEYDEMIDNNNNRNNNKNTNEKIKEEIEASLKNAMNSSSELSNFILLEDPPENHHFIDNDNSVFSKSFYKTIMKEHKLLSTELPEEGDIIVAAFSSRLELLRAIIFGPKDTIYEGIYKIDIYYY